MEEEAHGGTYRGGRPGTEREHADRASGREDGESSGREENHVTESINRRPMARWEIGVCTAPLSPRGREPSPSMGESHPTSPTTARPCRWAGTMEHRCSALQPCLHPRGAHVALKSRNKGPKISHPLPMSVGQGPKPTGTKASFLLPPLGAPAQSWDLGPQTSGCFGLVVLPTRPKAQWNEGNLEAGTHKGLN